MHFGDVLSCRYLSQGSIDAQKVIFLPEVLLHQMVQVWPVIPAQLLGALDWEAQILLRFACL